MSQIIKRIVILSCILDEKTNNTKARKYGLCPITSDDNIDLDIEAYKAFLNKLLACGRDIIDSDGDKAFRLSFEDIIGNDTITDNELSLIVSEGISALRYILMQRKMLK